MLHPLATRVLFGQGQTLRNSPQLAKHAPLTEQPRFCFPRTALRCASSSSLCCYSTVCSLSAWREGGQGRVGTLQPSLSSGNFSTRIINQKVGSRLPCANLPTPRFIHTWTTTRSRNLWRGLLGTRGRCGMALGVAARTNIANALRHVRLPLRH